MQNLEINQILGVVVQEKESNMVFCSRWKFPTLGMTVLSGTSAPKTEPHIRFLYTFGKVYSQHVLLSKNTAFGRSDSKEYKNLT